LQNVKRRLKILQKEKSYDNEQLLAEFPKCEVSADCSERSMIPELSAQKLTWQLWQ